jgi:protein phosphatase
MATNTPDPNAPKPGGLLARLRGMMQSLKPPEDAPPPPADAAPAATPAPAEDEVLPTFDLPPQDPADGPPQAVPVTTPAEATDAIPAAIPVDGPAEAVPVADAAPVELEEFPAPPAAPGSDDEAPELDVGPAPEATPAEAVPARPCPVCDAPRTAGARWCDSCGYLFPPDEPARAAMPAGDPVNGTPAPAPSGPAVRVRERYELGALRSERAGVERFRGVDHGTEGQPVPVTVVRMRRPETAAPVAAEPVAEAVEAAGDEEILPTFGEPVAVAGPTTEHMPPTPDWPSPAWERNLLEVAQHPALPGVIDSFTEGDYDYLIEELPTGQSLWDAWDDPDATAEQRFGQLRQVCDALFHLHHAAAILEGLRPDIVVVTPEGRARLTDLGDLLPMPLPEHAPIRATLYTAPELLAGDTEVSARADLYSFGAMLYALHVGRELTETDFDKPGTPKPFVPRFPDIHPLFGRLVSKTFARELSHRFPTDEAGKEDPTGFTELGRVLEVCGRTMDDVRLEIAAWTTTGMVRTGNEDAFALFHCAESRMDGLGESALVILCDGMGGYEAGEVAAALAIQALRKYVLGHQMLRPLAGGSAFPPMVPPLAAGKGGAAPPPAEAEAPVPFDVEACKKLFRDALRDANKQVFTASRLPGGGRRTMGCTAELVIVNGRHVIVGHVGDSRTYHLHEGRLIQLTRDQTLVNRLVELGTLTAEEAEHHPRKNELQQAIGGQPDVEPGVYAGQMSPGDWVVVCSDGVSNHVSADELRHMLQSEAASAEMAARRLVNFVNIMGATDNATVVVLRAT